MFRIVVPVVLVSQTHATSLSRNERDSDNLTNQRRTTVRPMTGK
jgi:hypothetical protein